MKNILLPLLVFIALFHARAQDDFTLEQVRSYPFPGGLTAVSEEGKFAVAINKEGSRNIFVASAPDFELRQLTQYIGDTGQELSSIRISPDGQWVIYIRGGDFGSNWNDAGIVNPTFDPDPAETQIWSIPFEGGNPVALGAGEDPVISPDSEKVLFRRGGQLYEAPIDGRESAVKLFQANGSMSDGTYSPDGTAIAFRSWRGDHSFIGVYRNGQSLTWIAPSFHRDDNPVWSPDGTSLVFARQSVSGGAPDSILTDQPDPWKLMHYNFAGETLTELWQSPNTVEGRRAYTQGGLNLNYGDGFISFVSYHDGWPHIWSIPETGGEPRLLTPGDFMVEYLSMDAEGRNIYFCANTGDRDTDVDRRHIGVVDIAEGNMKMLTSGNGNEWTPVPVNSGQIAYISAGAKRPPLPAVLDLDDGSVRLLGEDLIPDDFPTDELVQPEQVVFESSDGLTIHGTLFRTKMRRNEQRPAVIYIHGGPPRQMLLGWHYSSYYSNAYAVNQYLASQGFVVLSVNYRLGIGYGYDFQYPPNAGWRGASEYRDIKAAGEWLARQDYVDADRIGVYGGSYGGYLTALALGRDSDLFAAGVDIHGVHDRSDGRVNRFLRPDRYERAPDADLTLETIWKSSPVAYVDTWSSPVLVIHADDDRNVQFEQSTDLVRRLMDAGVPLETLVIVDDTHHFMLHANQLQVNEATVEFLIRKLRERD